MQHSKFDTYSYNSCKEVEGSLNQMKRILSNYEEQSSLENLSKEDLNDLIYRSEKIGISCRKSWENQEFFEEISKENDINSLENLFKNYKISVDFSNKILKISCPLTFKKEKPKNHKWNYMYKDYIKLSLKKWQEENDFNLDKSLETPIVIFMIRKGIGFNRSKICDNDNMENGRIINEICTVLGCSDNAMQMDLISCYRPVQNIDDCGMEFLVVERNNVESVLKQVLYM